MPLPLVLLLEATVLVPLPHTPTMAHDAIVHAVTGLTDQAAGSPKVTPEGLAVPQHIVPPAFWPVMQQIAAEPTPGAALTKIRAVLPQLHLEARTLRHPERPAPKTAAELEEQLAFRSWPRTVVAPSAVKGLTRVLYRGAFASVAETLETTTDDLTAPVRETELILDREDGSGAADFYAYDEAGNLATTSTFRNAAGGDVKTAVPYACMACHYDREKHAFTRLAEP